MLTRVNSAKDGVESLMFRLSERNCYDFLCRSLYVCWQLMNNHLVLAPPLCTLSSLRLKVQQGLLVDFAAFPQKFIDLLELCITESSKEKPKYISTCTRDVCQLQCIW